MTAIVLLIKRPLIEIGPVLIAGFDPKRLQASIDLPPLARIQDLQDCSQSTAGHV